MRFRHTCRITVTIPERVHYWIHERSVREGRSASNLIAVLLQKLMDAEQLDQKP